VGAERIRPTEVARLTSLSLRQIQSMAVAGRIPGAAKLGGVWTFDPDKIAAWVRAAEREALRSGSAGFRRVHESAKDL
jgi:hypothetical protein